jgi:hypothetical protein
MLSKPRACTYLGISLLKTWLLSRRQPACRRRESDTGFYKELREPVILRMKYKTFWKKKTRAAIFVEKIARQRPELFVHWRNGIRGAFA